MTVESWLSLFCLMLSRYDKVLFLCTLNCITEFGVQTNLLPWFLDAKCLMHLGYTFKLANLCCTL